MIIQQFNSGLGNQMFQYAFFRLLKKSHPEARIRADLSWFEWNDVHQGYELEKLFGIKLPKASPLETALASGQFPVTIPAGRYINRALRIFDQKYIDAHCVDELPPEKVQKLDPAANVYLTGFYISERYYKDDLDSIRREFAFSEEDTAGASVVLHHIESVESVSVHVRRGDYLDPVYKDRFDLLGEEYYREATARMKGYFGRPHFFIFSDDKEFIKQAFDWIPAEDRTIVAGNTGADSWKDMFLMSRCKGNILANSTFSTWGALLGKPGGRRVIYPRAYISGTDSEIKTIDGWERL